MKQGHRSLAVEVLGLMFGSGGKGKPAGGKVIIPMGADNELLGSMLKGLKRG